LPRIEECASVAANIIVPEAEFTLTLDADSLVLSDYILKLAQLMNLHPKTAVVQTPYSAIPGSRSWLQRAAGAQTDMQYIIHQGFTHFRATYWVGANALLRLAALRDIQQTISERGYPIQVFIQDRTVIEDTGSTIDLVRKGWCLHNHPERLAYTATPPDFGSLIIQRRRWANGGLIIFPDLLRYAVENNSPRPRVPEVAMRAYYLCSPAITSLALILLSLKQFADGLTTIWVHRVALLRAVCAGSPIARLCLG
jgi:cellulose synthase (UDP-forming)